ncbi:hypothetical protein TthSNM33_14520 [Thermus thermophilus]|nr:hypothetical protein TthSNM33_14520 [Thermus thermophilus]
MRRSWLAVLLLGGLALAQKPNVVIGTGGVGGVYFYYGTTLAELWNKAGVATAQAVQTAASIDNILTPGDPDQPPGEHLLLRHRPTGLRLPGLHGPARAL